MWLVVRAVDAFARYSKRNLHASAANDECAAAADTSHFGATNPPLWESQHQLRCTARVDTHISYGAG